MTSLNTFCPYVGIQPYAEEDREYFFGREKDQRIILSNLYASPLTILYGESGVGKTSVLLAGVVPSLRIAPRTAVVVFREWQSSTFLNALKSKCINAAELAANKPLAIDSKLPLDELLFSVAKAIHGSIMILLDQFEEYFLYHPESATGNPFENEFARAINREEVDAGFLIILREDGLSKLDRLRIRIPNLLSNTLRLQHLDVKAARDAIRKPLSRYNELHSVLTKPFQIETRLVEKLVEQVVTGRVTIGQSGRGQVGDGDYKAQVDSTRIETPFLQLVLTRLWGEEVKAKSHTLRLKTFIKLGGAEQIVRAHLDDVLHKFSQNELELCSKLFDRLVTPSGTKIALTMNDLIGYAGEFKSLVPSILEVLSKNRILRNVKESGELKASTRYEIFHDVLSPAVMDWRARYLLDKEHSKKVKQIRKEAHIATENYLGIRRTIGILGILFSCIIPIAAISLFRIEIPASFTQYYYTGLRDIFVATLCAIGILLFSYKGYNLADSIISNVGGVFVIGMALFPAAPETGDTNVMSIIGLIHYFSTVVFIMVHIYFSLFSFSKGSYSPTLQKRKRNRVYRTCGYTMITCVFLITIYELLPNSFQLLTKELKPIYWLECISFLAFSISWLTKGQAIYKDVAIYTD